MIPTRVLFNSMVDRFDVANRGVLETPDTIPVIAFINAPFNPLPTLVFGDVELEDAHLVNTTLSIASGQTMVYNDPVVNERVIQWGAQNTFFLAQTADADPPFTLFGTALLNGAEDTLFATQPLPAPLTFTAVGQGQLMPLVEFRFPFAMMR